VLPVGFADGIAISSICYSLEFVGVKNLLHTATVQFHDISSIIRTEQRYKLSTRKPKKFGKIWIKFVVNGRKCMLKHRPSKAKVLRIYIHSLVVLPADCSVNVPVKLPISDRYAVAADWVNEATELQPVFLFWRARQLLRLLVLNGLFCADVPLRNYSLTHSRSYLIRKHLNIVLIQKTARKKQTTCLSDFPELTAHSSLTKSKVT